MTRLWSGRTPTRTLARLWSGRTSARTLTRLWSGRTPTRTLARLWSGRTPARTLARLWSGRTPTRTLARLWSGRTPAAMTRLRSLWRTSAITGRTTGTRRGRRSVGPVRLLVIPRAAAVIIAPVRTDRKRHDRKADRGSVSQDRYIATLIRIAEAPCVDPAAQVGHHHVAPCVAADATHDRYGHAARQLSHDRVITRRPGAQVDRAVRVRLLLRERHAGQCQQPCKSDTTPLKQLFSHMASRRGSAAPGAYR